MARQLPQQDSPTDPLTLARVRVRVAELLEGAVTLSFADLAEASEMIADLVIGHDLEPQKAVAWFCQVPLPELGGATAAHYVAAGESQAIRRYIDNLAAGATG